MGYVPDTGDFLTPNRHQLSAVASKKVPQERKEN